MLKVVAGKAASEELAFGLDEICREGADERDERGRRLVVRNGHVDARTVKTAAGRGE